MLQGFNDNGQFIELPGGTDTKTRLSWMPVLGEHELNVRRNHMTLRSPCRDFRSALRAAFLALISPAWQRTVGAQQMKRNPVAFVLTVHPSFRPLSDIPRARIGEQIRR